MSARRLLIVGATGLLGPYLVAEGRSRGAIVDTLGRTHGGVARDLTVPADLREVLNLSRYDAVVNAVALTDVDACERDPDLAFAVNAGIVESLVAGLATATHLVQVSTDQVYPDEPGPHLEERTAPVNAYGRSKLAGEAAALEHGRTTVLRTNFFGTSLTPGRESLSDWAIGALERGEALTGFTGSLFSPLRLDTVARWCIDVIDAELVGTFNLGSTQGMSKYDFILELARARGLDASAVRPVDAHTAPGRAPRAGDLRLDVGLIEARTGTRLASLVEEMAP